MKNKRLASHPILPVPQRKSVQFTFNGKKYKALEGEVISSALFAHGIKIFGHHPRDGSPQGIFCANGQCAQCTVIADGLPVKACMAAVREGMVITPCDGLPALPEETGEAPICHSIPLIKCEVLVIGAGPSGLTAAIELGRLGKDVIIADDKASPGGKLVLQTHTFFGSISDCYAGTRGIDIATKLAEELRGFPSVKLWLNSTAIGVFKDRKVGILSGDRYVLVEPQKLLIAAGAREKALSFPGWDLPGVYGAGAFQTLLNRDLVKASERLFIIGGGNVGIIAGYHALQAGIKVIGLVEAMPQVGGYLVHANKLQRFGVPLYVSHTVVECLGGEKGVEEITICEIDPAFRHKEGTFKTFKVDTVLVAVGLTPIDELFHMARSFGMDVFAAGDAEEIAEASAAMFSGKIKGLEIAADLGEKITIPREWREKNEVLKSKPGKIMAAAFSRNGALQFPVFHCVQEIPCNPCTEVCPNNSITIPGGDIMGIPRFEGKCSGCQRCIAICPGLAVTTVDLRQSGRALVSLPFELDRSWLEEGQEVALVDIRGTFVTRAPIEKIADRKFQDRTLIVTVPVPPELAGRIAGIRLFEEEKALESHEASPDDEVIICRCERITAGRVREAIREGLRDMNELKTMLRCGMGSCGGKTCSQLIERLFRGEKVKEGEVTPFTKRPLEMEVTLEIFAGITE
ncbi:MAG: FAD-dependent oxidoreductase [Candidatus Eremiobacteraeota bacterium]|nr:FAD-dependent oxidoreductase [Candidatus Eremiobacteraeota bacterium]